MLLLLLTAVPHVIHLVPHAMGPPNHNASLVVPAALPTMVNVWIAAPMVTMPIKNVKNVLPVRRAVPHVPPMVFVLHAKTTGRAIKKENVLSLAVKIAMNVSMNLNFCAKLCVCVSVLRNGTMREHAYMWNEHNSEVVGDGVLLSILRYIFFSCSADHHHHHHCTKTACEFMFTNVRVPKVYTFLVCPLGVRIL